MPNANEFTMMLLRRNLDSRITAQPRGGVRLGWSSQGRGFVHPGR